MKISTHMGLHVCECMLTSPHCSVASLLSSAWRLLRLSFERPLAFFSSSSGGLLVPNNVKLVRHNN